MYDPLDAPPGPYLRSSGKPRRFAPPRTLRTMQRPRRPPRVLQERLGFVLNTVAHDLMSHYMSALSLQRLDPRTFAILAAAAANGPLRERTIAYWLAIDRTTIGRLMCDLERAELVERDRSHSDRRVNEVWVTGFGREKVRHSLGYLEQAEERFLEPLPEERRAAFAADLAALLPTDVPVLIEMLRPE